MEKLARYLTPDDAAETLRSLAAQVGATEYAQVPNLDYVFAPFELYPLTPRVSAPLDHIAAFTVDMDGTSTTTEPLALHSLEYMVRRFTGLRTPQQWAGFDPQLDLPHVIGNSNFRHTEFLVRRYRDRLSRESLGRAFIEAVGWTLSNMSDPHRRSEVTRHARACGLADLLADGDFQVLVARGSVTADNVDEKTQSFARRFGPAFVCDHFDTMVATALDIYYMRYHSLLRAIEQGQADRLGRELLGRPGRHLIEPMPGYEVFLPLIKGWLGPEVEALYELLRDHLLKRADLGYTAPGLDGFRPRLVRLAEHFRRHPVKVALVTASIAYETHASMKEVFRVLAKRIRDWPVTPACAEALAGRLADYRTVFDSVICAADACEHRLKPHRDLYSLALHEMSIPKGQYACCVGLEDTEPGIIALRAAGIGCAVALPNRDTSGQDYRAAAEIVPGGLPELILARNLLLAEEAPS